MPTVNKPIKRHDSLQSLSREHHQGLLLCWKIKTGLKKNIDKSRINRYCDYYYEVYLLPHFEEEEKHIFPVLGFDNEHVKQALEEHKELKKLFAAIHADADAVLLEKIEEKLENHIRFEERVLFNEIQEVATKADWDKINKAHQHEAEQECWSDRFWA